MDLLLAPFLALALLLAYLPTGPLLLAPFLALALLLAYWQYGWPFLEQLARRLALYGKVIWDVIVIITILNGIVVKCLIAWENFWLLWNAGMWRRVILTNMVPTLNIFYLYNTEFQWSQGRGRLSMRSVLYKMTIQREGLEKYQGAEPKLQPQERG